MTMKLNIFGEAYDDKEPCFIQTSQRNIFWNRINKKIYSKKGLDNYAQKIGYVWGENERGYASEEYANNNKFINIAIEEKKKKPKAARISKPKKIVDVDLSLEDESEEKTEVQNKYFIDKAD